MKQIVCILTMGLLLVACEKDGDNTDPKKDKTSEKEANTWLIPASEVRDGGPGKDGIPALTDPAFVLPSEVTYLKDDDLILGYKDGEDLRAYPHDILDWHEIINDETANEAFAVIYCPLTGTGIAWDRNIGSKKTTFGVSGLLYNSNIIPYDRESDSQWSQILQSAVFGELAGAKAMTHSLVETTWKTWKKMYPSSKVVSNNTGYNRSYGTYPYGSYKTSGGLIFPVNNKDDRLQAKERVLGIMSDEDAKVYRFNSFTQSYSGFTDQFKGEDIMIVGSIADNLIIAFNRKLNDGTLLSFEVLNDQLPAFLKDSEGNHWDVFGNALNGPRKGQTLSKPTQMMGYWFAWPAFYPDLEIYME